MGFAQIYVRFERAMAFLILAGMVVVIGLTLYSFGHSVLSTLGTLPDEMGYGVFQTLFDRVLAAVAARPRLLRVIDFGFAGVFGLFALKILTATR